MSNGRALFVVGVLGLLGVGCRAGHRFYVAEGNIEISPPGPPGVTAPAAVCIWANGYQVAMPMLAKDAADGRAYVVCTLDSPASIPFTFDRYSTSGSGFLIGAYLVSIPDGHPACAGSTGTIKVDDAVELGGLCDGDMPAKSEVALMLPFDDDEGRPTPTVRISITKAE